MRSKILRTDGTSKHWNDQTDKKPEQASYVSPYRTLLASPMGRYVQQKAWEAFGSVPSHYCGSRSHLLYALDVQFSLSQRLHESGAKRKLDNAFKVVWSENYDVWRAYPTWSPLILLVMGKGNMQWMCNTTKTIGSLCSTLSLFLWVSHCTLYHRQVDNWDTSNLSCDDWDTVTSTWRTISLKSHEGFQ